MSDGKDEDAARGLVLEFELEAPPHKVWRAISIAEFREQWLPNAALAEPEAAAVTPGEQVRYRMREAEPPFLESVVTFKVAANGTGGTSLRVVHEVVDVPAPRMRMAANDNRSLLLRAA
jgi:uncharacterized protein YndB with AHSA1/START domain